MGVLVGFSVARNDGCPSRGVLSVDILLNARSLSFRGAGRVDVDLNDRLFLEARRRIQVLTETSCGSIAEERAAEAQMYAASGSS
jgi:hypothetical protein